MQSAISMPITSGLLMKNENMKKSFEVRKILEVGADKLAALQQTADDLKLMRQALDAMLPTKRYLNKKAVHFLHKLNVQL